ncbi:hypothetical protein [Streptomyces sp. HPF1205]|uniref:hypothetical protein n=1 Tax=Streptomyces sp. HPF1205 TaxID=2873262 RepID=UPI001CED5836|nr:hypothetical protein [Streptomyces sp. HPF1205]
MASAWFPRPLRLPDAHLPRSLDHEPTCRTCGTSWPCETATEHLSPGRCSCGSVSYWEKHGPRRWHVGPRCYTSTDLLAQAAKEAHEYHQAHPHYPPSHYYPPKPARRRRQKPPYRHTPGGPGDVAPGTWCWVRPGGLHPGWGDIHHLAMLTAPGTDRCEVWVYLDSTVHRVRPSLLILDVSALGIPRDGRGRRRLPDWAGWTVARHLDHRAPQVAQPVTEPAEQQALFADETMPDLRFTRRDL